MSVSAMPAASSTAGKEALPATVRTSMRLCRSRSTDFVGIDHRDFVVRLARQVIGRGAA